MLIMKRIISVVFLCLSLCFIPTLWAADSSFVVRKVEIIGLQRVSVDTVRMYLPIREGQVLRPSQTAEIIRALYQTNFFDNISLTRQGDTLVVTVIERPTIGQIKITGNSYIPKDKLDTVMKSVDIAEGRIYNRAMLDKIKQSLLNQYYQFGRYNARVDVNITCLSRNRVLIKIDISEGLVTQVRRINIIGVRAFNQKCLEKQMSVLSTSGWFTFFTQTDRYSQEKLDESLENLRNFYLDHGYVKFAVKSTQVQLTPDRKSIYLTIVIDEGCPYTIKGFALTGDLILPREELMSKIKIAPGALFSRKAVMEAERVMSGALGEKGYIMAGISLNPQIIDATHEVFLNFEVHPGKLTYVHHIFFSDNSRTNDVVLRRELPQMEAAVASTSQLEESKRRLGILPFVKDVQMALKPVPNTDDQVDINYKITENNSAEMTASIGYSQLDHVILSAGFNQKNFLGTGKTLGLNFSRSRFQSFYGVSYTDPYYTQDGISRTISASVATFDPAKANLMTSYSTNQYDATVLYGIPIGHEPEAISRVQLGYGYQNTVVQLSNSVSTQVSNFTNRYGRNYKQLLLMTGISRDSRDKAIFPTQGMLHSLGINFYVPAASESLKYYTVAYNAKWYQRLCGPFIATARSEIAYGNSLSGGAIAYPFFKNYYAGGPDSVRGFLGNSLGPRDNLNNSTGGNFLADASVGLIFPNYISDNLRTTAFIDGGNVYNTFDNRSMGGAPSGPPRFSFGIEGDWLTPFGLIDVSFAKRIIAQPHDKLDFFQFSLGANFS